MSLLVARHHVRLWLSAMLLATALCILCVAPRAAFAAPLEPADRAPAAGAGQLASPRGQEPKPTPPLGAPAKRVVESVGTSTPIRSAAGDQVHPALAFNSQAGEYLVAWEEQGQYPGLVDIKGQRVDTNGQPVGSMLALAQAGSGAEVLSVPDLAYNATANEYLLVFQSYHSEADVFAQRLAGDGTPLGNWVSIATSSLQETRPKVAFNAYSNEYLVVWERFSGGEMGKNDVIAQRVSQSGALVNGQITIAATTYDSSRPAIASGDGQGYLVAWQARDSTATYDIHGWRLGSDATKQGSELTVTSASNDQTNPRVAFSPRTHIFLVVWQHDYYGNGSDWDIYGQRVYAWGYGELAGSNFGISTDSRSATVPDVAYHPNAHEYLVSWEYAYTSTDHDVYLHRVDENGNVPEGDIGLETSAALQTNPRLAAGGAWSYQVVWEDNRESATQGIDIYGGVAHLYPLAGKVWAGGVGTETTPVAGVTVQLYCSANATDAGTLVESTITDGTGAYGLNAAGLCSYYNIVETDLAGYVSAGATSAGGTVVSENRIQYSGALAGKTLNSNQFYDHPPSGIAHCNSCGDCTAKLGGGYSLVYLDNDISTAGGTCVTFGTSNATLDCLAHKIEGSGIAENNYGVQMASRSLDTVQHCQIKKFAAGINLSGSTYNKVIGNSLTFNGTGLYLGSSDHNTVGDNIVAANGDGMNLNLSNANALSNNGICKNTNDIMLRNPNSGNTSTGDTCDTRYGWNWNGTGEAPSDWCDKTCTPNVATTCGSAQTCLDSLAGGFNYVKLTSNFAVPDGLRVTGNHLTLDCDGHALTGNGSGSGIMLENRLDVTVYRCSVQNYATGVELRNASKNTVTQNDLSSNSTGIAVIGTDALYPSRYNTVSGNTSIGNSWYGILLDHADKNNIATNNLTMNGQYGLWVKGTCNNTVTGNTSGLGGTLLYWHDVANPGTVPAGNYGQVLLCGVQNAAVQGLNMDHTASPGNGIVVLSSSGVQLSSNVLKETNGLYVADSQQVTLSDNQVTHSIKNALELSACSGCQVNHNTLTDNDGATGVYSGTGVFVANQSPQLQLYNNTVLRNGVGVWLQDVSGPTLISNTIRFNQADGVYLAGTSGMTFNQNDVRSNDYGLELDLHSPSANLQNNHLCYNKSLDILNVGQNSAGAGNSCIGVSNWFDAGRLSPGCSQKCIGWYPYLYGFGFQNASKSMLSFGCPYGGCQGDYVDTFGESQVYHSIDICIGLPLCFPFVGCTCLGYEAKVPTPVPEPHALTWYFAAYAWAATPGQCTGMSTTSLRLQHGDKRLSDYGPGANKTSDLAYYGDLANAIASGQGAIMSDELAKSYLSWWARYNAGEHHAVDVLNQVKQSIADDKLGSLVMSALTAGHTVVATDVREDANTAYIYIYDSNKPWYSTHFPDAEDQYPRIVIHKDTDTWEYADGKGYYSLYYLPYSKVTGGLTIPLSWKGDLFANWGSTTSQVSDPAGQRMGWQGDQFLHEIPDAAPYPKMDSSQAVTGTNMLYMLPAGQYTVTLNGAGTGTYNAAVFDNNSMFVLWDVPATAATRDTMTYSHENDDPPTGSFAFSSPDASKPYTATIGERFAASGSGRVYTLKNCMTAPGARVVVGVSPDFKALRFTNRASTPVRCDVELKNTMTSDQAGTGQSLPTAELPGVVVPAMTTAVFTPADWLNLNKSTIDTRMESCGDNVCGSSETSSSCPEDCRTPSCVVPHDDMHVTSSTILCPGSYTLPDRGSAGVISVDADHVTLDCGGARLVGDGAGTGIVAAGRSSVTLTRCAVQGYATGVDLRNAADSQVTSSVMISNTVQGLAAAGAQRLQILENYVAANAAGVDISGTAGTRLSSNLACGNASLDVAATSLANGVGTGNRCDKVAGWQDQGGTSCTYACVLSSPSNMLRFYLPMVRR